MDKSSIAAFGEYDTMMIMEAVREYLKKKDYILFAYLFGSCARENSGKFSDIDIAVYTSDYLHYDDYLDMIKELGDLTGKPVDIVPLNEAPPLLCYQVIQEGKLLLTKDRESVTRFIIKTIFMYEDMRPYLDLSYKTMIKQLKEELQDGF